jgi:metal-responsive CopG/Arc/MetJ family transcriptional regulator
MATVNFSVPDELKAEFDRVFGGQNKSAVIAELMRQAIADVTRRARREKLFNVLTQQRKQRPSASNEEIRSARTSGRP